MVRPTLLVALLVLVLLAGTALPPDRIALGAACAAGLVLLSVRRRRSLMAFAR